MTKIKFILPSIFNGWPFWSESYTLMVWNSELDVFNGIKFVGEISNKLPIGLFGANM